VSRRRDAAVPLAVVILVVAAGCAGLVPPDLPGGRAPDAHPWHGTVVVGVAGPDADRVAPLVAAATDYWADRAEQYAGPPVAFAVRPDADDPDVLVRTVETLESCDGVRDAAGCAPHLTAADRPLPDPVVVTVRAGLRDDSTLLVVRHEFGHLLGLDHDDEPAAVMSAAAVVYTRPAPNATDRRLPWPDRTFSVHVDARNASDVAVARAQVRVATDYFAAGPPGTPANLSFASTADPGEAEVLVRFADASACGDGPGSCGAVTGIDADGDGAVETYDRVTVTLVGVDPHAIGWHVGYWLAFALGAETDSEKPPPFRAADYATRHGRWWNRTTAGSPDGTAAVGRRSLVRSPPRSRYDRR
jgi:hypothetical protein